VASRLAIQPETFSRILARLAEKGCMEVHGQNIVLIDIEALRTIVSQ
jgi:Mn-dependent DtxR family transcriptional regulator